MAASEAPLHHRERQVHSRIAFQRDRRREDEQRAPGWQPRQSEAITAQARVAVHVAAGPVGDVYDHASVVLLDQVPQTFDLGTVQQRLRGDTDCPRPTASRQLRPDTAGGQPQRAEVMVHGQLHAFDPAADVP